MATNNAPKRWVDLSNHGMKLLLSDNGNGDRIPVLQIENINNTLASLGIDQKQFFTRLLDNNFIIDEKHSNTERVHLIYKSDFKPESDRSFKLEHLRNVLGIQSNDELTFTTVTNDQITLTSAQSPHLAEWRDYFQIANQELQHQKVWVVKDDGPEISFAQMGTKLFNDAHPFYSAHLSVSSLPIYNLSSYGYSSKLTKTGFTSLDQALRANYTIDDLVETKLTGYSFPLSVNKDNSITFVEDARKISELFHFSPNEHHDWLNRSHLFSVSEKNFQIAKSLEQDIVKNYAQGGVVNMRDHLHHLEGQMRSLNLMQKNKMGLHNPVISTENEILKYPVFDKVNDKWDYYETDYSGKVLRHTNLTAILYKGILEDRMQYAKVLSEKVLNSNSVGQNPALNVKMIESQYVAFGRHIGRSSVLRNNPLSEVQESLQPHQNTSQTVSDDLLQRVSKLKTSNLVNFFESSTINTINAETKAQNQVSVINKQIAHEVDSEFDNVFSDKTNTEDALINIGNYRNLPDGFIVQEGVNKEFIKELYALRQQMAFIELPQATDTVSVRVDQLIAAKKFEANFIAKELTTEQLVKVVGPAAQSLEVADELLKESIGNVSALIGKYEVIHNVVNTALGLSSDNFSSLVVVHESGNPIPFVDLENYDKHAQEAKSEYQYLSKLEAYEPVNNVNPELLTQLENSIRSEVDTVLRPALSEMAVEAKLSEQQLLLRGFGQLYYYPDNLPEQKLGIPDFSADMQMKIFVDTLSSIKTSAENIAALPAEPTIRNEFLTSHSYKQIMLTGLLPLAQCLVKAEDITGKNCFGMAPEGDSVSDYLRKLGRANMHLDLDGFVPTIEQPAHPAAVFPVTDNGFLPSNTLIKDALQKTLKWGISSVDAITPTYDTFQLSARQHGYIIQASHFEQMNTLSLKNENTLATYFAKNFIPTTKPPVVPKSDKGWAISQSDAAEPFKLHAVDLTNVPSNQKAIPAKDYDDAISNQYNEFRKSHLANTLGLNKSSLESIDVVVKGLIARTDSPAFNAATTQLFGVGLAITDFDSIKVKNPENVNSIILERVADIEIGNTKFDSLYDQQIDHIKNRLDMVISIAGANGFESPYLNSLEISPLIKAQAFPDNHFYEIKDYFKAKRNENFVSFNPLDYETQINALNMLVNSSVEKLKETPALKNDSEFAVYTTSRTDKSNETLIRILPVELADRVAKFESTLRIGGLTNPFSEPLRIDGVHESKKGFRTLPDAILSKITECLPHKVSMLPPSVTNTVKPLPQLEHPDLTIPAEIKGATISIHESASPLVEKIPPTVRTNLVVLDKEKTNFAIAPDFVKQPDTAIVVPLSASFSGIVSQKDVTVTASDKALIDNLAQSKQTKVQPKVVLDDSELMARRINGSNLTITQALNLPSGFLNQINVDVHKGAIPTFNAETGTIELNTSARKNYVKPIAHAIDAKLLQLEIEAFEKQKKEVPVALSQSKYLSRAIEGGYQPVTPTGNKFSELLQSAKVQEKGGTNPATMIEEFKGQEKTALFKLARAFDEHCPMGGTQLKHYIEYQADSCKTLFNNMEAKLAKGFIKDAKYIQDSLLFNDITADGIEQYKEKIDAKPILNINSSLLSFIKSDRKAHGLSQIGDSISAEVQALSEKISSIPPEGLSAITECLTEHKKAVGAASLIKLLNETGPLALRNAEGFYDALSNTSISSSINMEFGSSAKQTNFMKSNSTLDSLNTQPYYSLPEVVVAHIFQAKVDSYLQNNGERNDFLSSQAGDNLPQGIERDVIFNHLDSFSNELKNCVVNFENIHSISNANHLVEDEKTDDNVAGFEM